MVISFTNCQNKSTEVPNLNEEKFKVYEKNEELIDNILSFIEAEPFPSVISLDYKEKYDTVYFKISPIINLFAIEHYSPVYSFELDQSIIVIYSEIKGLKRYSGENLDSLMKKCFPFDYKFYKEKGFCPPPTGYECDVWILKFKNGKLVEREKHPYPETENNRWTKEKFN